MTSQHLLEFYLFFVVNKRVFLMIFTNDLTQICDANETFLSCLFPLTQTEEEVEEEAS